MCDNVCMVVVRDVKTALLNDVYYLDLNDPNTPRSFLLFLDFNYDLSEITVASILPFSISSFWVG